MEYDISGGRTMLCDGQRTFPVYQWYFINGNWN